MQTWTHTQHDTTLWGALKCPCFLAWNRKWASKTYPNNEPSNTNCSLLSNAMNSHYCLLLYSRIPPRILHMKYNNIINMKGRFPCIWKKKKSKSTSDHQRSIDENVPLRIHERQQLNSNLPHQLSGTLTIPETFKQHLISKKILIT